MANNSAISGARSQAKMGYDYSEVFGRIWFSKLQRLGFLTDNNDLATKDSSEPELQHWVAVVTLYHMRKPAREAIQYVLLEQSVRPIFVIIHVTKDQLSRRTLGAEDPDLARRIMNHKIADIEKPDEGEKDVILVDSMQDVDSLFLETMEKIRAQLGVGA